jgi:hypothetical protein
VKAKGLRDSRPKQELPADIMDDLLGAVHRQFCPDLQGKAWFTQVGFFRRVLTWPASWLDRRGVSLPPARYKEILLGVFNEIKGHGNTSVVKRWPGYLLRCLQSHFSHQGDRYYEEGKSIRALADRALLSYVKSPGAEPQPEDPIRTLAAAHRLLSRKPAAGGRQAAGKQLDLGLG